MQKRAFTACIVFGISSCIAAFSLKASEETTKTVPGERLGTQLQNWCDFQATTWVWQEGFNLTKTFVDTFDEGLRNGPPLKDLVSEALAEFGMALDPFQQILMDFLEGWIKNNIIEDLILELVYVEAQIAVAMTTGTAVCTGLLDQAGSLIAQLMENGVCCIMCDDWFWDQVTTVACQLMEGMNHFIGVTSSNIPNLSVSSLKVKLEQVALSFEDMILSAVNYPTHIVKTHSGGDFAEDLHQVRKAISTWAQSTIDTAFSGEATILLEQLLQHLTEGSAFIQSTIDSSTSSLMDWVLSSSCSLQDGNEGSILVNVTAEAHVQSWHHYASIQSGIRGTSQALKSPRFTGGVHKYPTKLPSAGALVAKCEDLLQIVPACPAMENGGAEDFPRLPSEELNVDGFFLISQGPSVSFSFPRNHRSK